MPKKTTTVEPDEVKPPSPSASERVKASKLRARVRAGFPLSPEEAAELHDYESARAATARGASASRKVQYTEEESAAIGEGSAAAEAAAAGAMVRAEGQRLDSVLALSITALRTACDQYAGMVQALIKRTENFESAQVRMMNAQTDLIHRVRNAELDRIDAEIAAREAESEEKGGDTISKMAEQLLPMLMPQIMGAMGKGGKSS
jgi:hypothetical protein